MNKNGYAVVSEKEKGLIPYVYIYVNEDGSYRELRDDERKYLEEKFHPADGNRPYVKSTFYSKTPDGKISGFLNRTKLPQGRRRLSR